MYIRLYIKIIRNFGSSDRIVGSDWIRSDPCTSLLAPSWAVLTLKCGKMKESTERRIGGTQVVLDSTRWIDWTYTISVESRSSVEWLRKSSASPVKWHRFIYSVKVEMRNCSLDRNDTLLCHRSSYAASVYRPPARCWVLGTHIGLIQYDSEII